MIAKRSQTCSSSVRMGEMRNPVMPLMLNLTLVYGNISNSPTEKLHLPTRREDEAHQHLHCRALARAVRPQKSKDLTLADGDRQRIDRDLLAVFLPQIARLHGGNARIDIHLRVEE